MKEFSCSRCNQPMEKHIFIVRGKYPHDVCEVCRDEIEEFITTPIQTEETQHLDDEFQRKVLTP